MAARESQLRSIINYGFQQNFIITATGNNLDAIGANYGIGPGTPGASSGLNGQRLPASFAITTLQFSLASSISTDTNIPVGTGVATGNGVIFATLADAAITAGTTSVSVAAQCLQPGVIGNGYTAGQVSSPQTSIAGVTSSVNTTTTQGGADAEGDDQYAQRLALLPGAFSVAGPIGAYKYWAFTSSAAIADVQIITPNTTPSVAAGNVNVCILLQGGVIPGSSVLAAVQAIFSNDIRPQGDVVTVIAPSITTYNVSLTWYLNPSRATLQPTVAVNVANAVTAFNTYNSSGIGRTISPGYLEYLLWNAGVSDAVISSPSDTTLDLVHVGQQSGTMTVTYGGLRS